jgi:hypothetical protein
MVSGRPMTYDENPKPRRAKPEKVRDTSRAFCDVCGRWPNITAGGRLSKHDYPAPWADGDPAGTCPGTGRLAKSQQTELFELTNPKEGSA